MGNEGAGDAGRLLRLGKTVACFGLAGTTALACGGTAEDDSGGSDSDAASSTTSSTTGAGSITSLDDLLRELPATACRSECNEAASFEFLFDAECLEIYTLLYESLGVSIQRSLDAGTVSFDASAAQGCVDALAASPCDEVVSASACNGVLVGQVPIAGSCTESEQCAGSAYCDNTLGCPGTCAASLAEGAACLEGGECATGLACSIDGVCDGPKPAGELCNSSVECQTRYCEQQEEDARCAEAPQLFVKTLGEPCEFAYECERDLYCPLDGAAEARCAASPRLGEACQISGLKTACADGSYCSSESDDGAAGICVAEVPLGGSCTDPMQCTTGICDGGACEKHSPIGGPCTSDERCFGVCQDGVCAPQPACPEQG